MNKKYFFLFLSLTLSLIAFFCLREPTLSLLSALLTGIAPLIAGIIIAYLINHAVTPFEKLYSLTPIKNGNVIRILALASSVLLLLAFIVGLLFLALPALLDSGIDLSTSIPEYLAKLGEFATKIDGYLGLSGDFTIASLVQNVDANALIQSLENLKNGAISLIGTISVGLLLSVLLILEKEKIFCGLKKLADRIFSSPEKVKNGARCIIVLLDGYVYGKIIEGAVTALIFSILYYVLSIPYALLLAMLMGLLFTVPYVGGYVALIPALFLSFEISPTTALVVLIAGVVLLNVLGSVISPYIFKNKLKVSPLTIMASITVGGTAFGIIGFLLAPPIIASIKLFFSVFINSRKDSLPLQKD